MTGHLHTHKGITRRGFIRTAGMGAVALATAKKAMATGVPFTVAMIPDPQYLAGDKTCSGSAIYNALIQWGITNRNLSVNGTPLNIKGFLQVGDCANTVHANSYDQQQQISVNAYALAEAASPKMFVVRCLGNHDYETPGGNLDRSTVAYMWRNDKGGAWSPTNLAAIYSGGMDLGNGDHAYFGGAYTDTPPIPTSSINSYMRLLIQGRKILVISLEFYPRSAVLVWARGIHDTYLDHECWVTTHGYMTHYATQFDRNTLYGPTAGYNLGAAPAANSGIEMWSGSDASWNGFTTWPNLSLVTCGHDIDGYNLGDGHANGWVWQRVPIPSTSTSAHTVQQVFGNCQGDYGNDGDEQNFCSGNPSTPDGVTDAAHLMLLRVWPNTGFLESFMVSANNNKWTGARGVINQTNPVQLFNVPFGVPLVGSAIFPLPNSQVRSF
jgi:hypothetical protein